VLRRPGAFAIAARAAAGFVAFLLMGVASWAADQKLVLTDGTDQQVSSYERKGDRVRFFSTERREWEEIPESLVDWKATEEANREAAKIPEDTFALEPKKTAPPRFQVAPGVELPESEGVYVYDGENLLALLQSQAEIQNDRTRQVLGTIAPVIKGRASVYLTGSAARVIVAGANPVFYLRLSQASPAGYGLVRVNTKAGYRIVGEILINPITRSQSESQQKIPLATEQLSPAAGEAPSIVRLSPKEPLSPGEYAVVEYVEKGKMNLFVWDFGFHPEGGGKKAP
jgi:hypothetical protein